MSYEDTGTPFNWVCNEYWYNYKCYAGYFFYVQTKNITIYYRHVDETLISQSPSHLISVEERQHYRLINPDESREYWENVNTEFITYNKSITLPLLPTKTGYTYTSWKHGTNTYAANQIVNLGNDTTFYANGTANTYNISWNTNGGTAVTTPTTATFDANFTFPSTSKTGYTFNGWYLNLDLTGTEYKNSITWTFTENQTFYAKFTINTYTYTLTLDPNGIGTGKNISVNYNSTISVPTLKAVGYTFNGYYNDSSGSTLVVSGGNTYTMPASDKTLYAKWTDNNIVKFSDLQDTYGGTYPIYMSEYQASISKASSNLTKLMIDFKGKGPAP